jgi:hypothetical protein
MLKNGKLNLFKNFLASALLFLLFIKPFSKCQAPHSLTNKFSKLVNGSRVRTGRIFSLVISNGTETHNFRQFKINYVNDFRFAIFFPQEYLIFTYHK